MPKRTLTDEENRKVQVNIFIKFSLRQALKSQVAKDNLGMNEAISKLIQGYVKGKINLDEI